MTRTEIKAKFDALKDSPNAPEYWGGMNGWYDRITPFEEFERRGKEVADAMRGMDENRAAFPELWDLLFSVY